MKAYPNHRSEGMDLRDYFAAQMMPTIFTTLMNINANSANEILELVAIKSYAIADEMMKARDNNEQ
jgi:hypothetical protein